MSADAGLRLNIGRATVAAADNAAVGAAIKAANEKARIQGVPDAFNPRTIDPEKAAALLKTLMAPPGTAIAPLAGRALILNALSLRIGTSSPTTAASFAQTFVLEVDSEHGGAVMARTSVPADCDLARVRAEEAKHLAEAADRDVSARTGDGVMPALLRRQAVTRAWFDNASAHAACVPHDPAAAAGRDAANKAMRAAIVIGGSME